MPAPALTLYEIPRSEAQEEFVAEARQKAIEVMEKAKAGEDFAELAKTYSDCPSKEKGGDLGAFKREDMVNPFADAAFSMAVGDISEPVRTQFGWHVIKLEDSRAIAFPELDKVKDRMQSGVAVIASVSEGKVSLIAGVTKDLVGKVKAGDLVNHVAQQVGGKGGGRPDMAQAGGTNPAALPDAMRSIEGWLEQRL